MGICLQLFTKDVKAVWSDSRKQFLSPISHILHLVINNKNKTRKGTGKTRKGTGGSVCQKPEILQYRTLENSHLS